MLSILFLLSSVVNVLNGQAITFAMCELGEADCVKIAAQSAYNMILKENKDIGAENLNPVLLEEVEGNLAFIKYKLYNTSTTGFQECEITKATFGESIDSVHVEFECPQIIIHGQYEMNGEVLKIPAQGNGDFLVTTKKYAIIIDVQLETLTKDGKNYKTIKSYEAAAEPLDSIDFKFDNLFNDNPELSANFHNMLNSNWKEAALEIQKPTYLANFDKVIENAKLYLQSIPIDEYTT